MKLDEVMLFVRSKVKPVGKFEQPSQNKKRFTIQPEPDRLGLYRFRQIPNLFRNVCK